MQITIDLTPAQVEVMKRAFTNARYTDPAELAQAVLPLLVEAWTGWISGVKRYNSLTEQYTDWLEAIYNHLLPEDEAPSAERLFNSFNLPYGQAQYIARVLNSRGQANWRSRAKDQLKLKMRACLDKVSEWIKEKKTGAQVELVLFRPAYQELNIIIENLFRADSSSIDLPRVTQTRNLVSVYLTARTFMEVWAALNPEE